ncbi:MAG: hypothetical protein ABIG60_01910 [Patescibacteria group bacterium]
MNNKIFFGSVLIAFVVYLIFCSSLEYEFGALVFGTIAIGGIILVIILKRRGAK